MMGANGMAQLVGGIEEERAHVCLPSVSLFTFW